jgi:hypothetical protein
MSARVLQPPQYRALAGARCSGGGDDLVRFLAGIRTSANGCFGIKAHYPHLRTLLQFMPIHEFASSFAHIKIVRRDLLAQAISFARAGTDR